MTMTILEKFKAKFHHANDTDKNEEVFEKVLD